ncbi:MAG: hypothetical protein NTX04_03135 [Verrucomicrobia bacterium]|nr:hypothetical protein [Verrucomicrobiota bacterium]
MCLQIIIPHSTLAQSSATSHEKAASVSQGGFRNCSDLAGAYFFDARFSSIAA